MINSCEDVVNQLIQERISKGMKPCDLAIAANLNRSTISRIESMSISPRLDTLLKITTALNCSIELGNLSTTFSTKE